MQDGEREERVEHDDAGRVRRRYSVAGDLLDGDLVQFDEEGRVQARLVYKAGVLDGDALFYDRGELQLSMHYRDGVEEGERIVHGPLGPAMKAAVKQGKLQGPVEWYQPDGKLLRTGQHVNGALEGEVVEYGERGRVAERAQYKEGRLHGELLRYDAAGKVREKLVFDKGVPQKKAKP